MSEQYLPPAKVARQSGTGVSEEFVRAACYRSADNHPLPHITVGRCQYPRVRVSTFLAWLDEEERIVTEGARA